MLPMIELAIVGEKHFDISKITFRVDIKIQKRNFSDFEHFYAVYGAKSVTNQQISEGCVDPSFFVDFREDMSPNRGAQK